MAGHLGELRYLYVGSADAGRDLAWYCDVLRAELVFDFAHFGTRVAGVRLLEGGPTILLAEHRPVPSVLPIIAVENLQETMESLKARGWVADGPTFGIPNGPCVTFHDPSGNQVALFENRNPEALEREYQNPENPHAVREHNERGDA